MATSLRPRDRSCASPTRGPGGPAAPDLSSRARRVERVMRGAGEPLGLSADQTAFDRRSTAALDRGPDRPQRAVDEQKGSKMLSTTRGSLLCAACALLAAGATPAHRDVPGHRTGRSCSTSDDGGGRLRHLHDESERAPSAQPDARLARPRRVFASWSPTDAGSRSGAPGRVRRTPTGDQEIFVMNADGSGQRQVTFNAVDDGGTRPGRPTAAGSSSSGT